MTMVMNMTTKMVTITANMVMTSTLVTITVSTETMNTTTKDRRGGFRFCRSHNASVSGA